MPFYPVAIGLLKQTLEEGLEGVRMESAMIRMTQLNRVWFTTVISLDQYILSVLSPSLFYSKNSYLLLLQVVSPRKLQFHHLIIAQVHRHNRLQLTVPLQCLQTVHKLIRQTLWSRMVFSLLNLSFFVFLYAIMFLSSYMWPCCTDYERMSYLRRTRKRMRRTFLPDKVHRVIVKTFFHKLSFNT